MSMATKILLLLNILSRLLRRLVQPQFQPLAQTVYGKADGRLDYARYLFEDGGKEFENYFKGKVNVKDKRVIDIGCGDGGKTCFYASLNPRICIGLDVDAVRIRGAEDFMSQMELSGINFIVGDAKYLPLPPDSFDLVVMDDCMEHLAYPAETLEEVNRILKEGGYALITFTSYRSAGGAHLSDWIALPWVQFMFSERVIIQALQHLSKSNRFILHQFPRLHGSTTPSVLTDVVDINKMTLRRFQRLASDSGFSIKLLTFRPFIEGKASMFLVKHLPLVIAEFLSRKPICILEKQELGR